ncbi:MAG: hypothetical protein GX912_12775, partial [Gammaproteobacteria bacterium]|nr:hypothetical protein [Gammaproteobacteria bacterium]
MILLKNLRYMAFSLALLLVAPGVWGQVTYTWNGATNQNWDESTNWTPSGPPGPLAYPVAGDTAIFNNVYTVDISSHPTVATLTIEGGGNVTLTGGGILTASNVTNDGTIAVGGNALSGTNIGGSGAVTVADGGSITAAGTIETLTTSGLATITLEGTINNLTVSAGTLTLNGTGTGLTVVDDPDGAITTTGTVTLNGAEFTDVTNSGTLTFNTDATLSGNLNVTAGTVTLNDDLNVSGTITISGSLAVGDFNLTQTDTEAFNVLAGGTVSIGNGTCTIGNLSVTDGSFTQTGINAGTQSATSLVTGGAGIIRWDFGSNGGTLTLAGNVTPSGGAISFGHKDVTFTANATGQGVFYDLTIANGGTFVANGSVRIMRHLDINGGGIYTNGGQTLTFGGTGSVDGGTITDSNAAGSKQDLGAVIIDAADQTKNADGGGILMTSMVVTAGTFSAGANTVDITDTLSGAGTFTGGTAAIDIDGDVTVTKFTAADNTTTNVGGNFAPVTSFTANDGTMIFDGTAGSTITAGTFIYNNVEIDVDKTTTNGTFKINGTLTTAGGATLDLDMNNTVLDVAGNTTNDGTITGGAGTVTFNGTVTNNGTGVITGGNALMTFGDALADTVTNYGTITAGPVADGSNA